MVTRKYSPEVLTNVSHEFGPIGSYLFVDDQTIEEVFVERLGIAVKGYRDDLEHGRFLCRRRDGAATGSWSFRASTFPSRSLGTRRKAGAWEREGTGSWGKIFYRDQGHSP
jgi:hypothetical protein